MENRRNIDRPTQQNQAVAGRQGYPVDPAAVIDCRRLGPLDFPEGLTQIDVFGPAGGIDQYCPTAVIPPPHFPAAFLQTDVIDPDRAGNLTEAKNELCLRVGCIGRNRYFILFPSCTKRNFINGEIGFPGFRSLLRPDADGAILSNDCPHGSAGHHMPRRGKGRVNGCPVVQTEAEE